MTFTCCVPECDRRACRQDMCYKHYLRVYRHGTVDLPPKPSVTERFWRLVNKDGPIHSVCGQCWLWTGNVSSAGYGRFGIRFESVLAHRYSWIIHNGKIADGLFVLHECDTPLCVNPDHLFLGTQFTNMEDMSYKERNQNQYTVKEKQ